MTDRLRVLLITPWGAESGIAEHSFYLKQAAEAADPALTIVPHYQRTPTILHPDLTDVPLGDYDVVHLDYHSALHSQWHPAHIAREQAAGRKVTVTWHDSGVPNSEHCHAIVGAADAAVVHEPFDDLPAEKVRYWRMGVPDWPTRWLGDYGAWRGWCGYRPILGSIGFPFGHKHFEELARISADCGWALLLIAPGATAEQEMQWATLNPSLLLRTNFVPRDEAVSLLAGCDATAFAYVTHGTGQSAAILQGIAARKPVLAFETCRQFRALYADPLGRETIQWCQSFEEVAFRLRRLPIQRVDPGIVALAEQESWAKLGAKYAALFHEVIGR